MKAQPLTRGDSWTWPSGARWSHGAPRPNRPCRSTPMCQTQPAPTPPRPRMAEALDYMGLRAGQKLTDVAVDQVFIGSCTNGGSRICAPPLPFWQGGGRKCRGWFRPVRCPSNNRPRPRGWTASFTEAGLEWVDAGCSMCVGMNGDIAAPGGASPHPPTAISGAARAPGRARI
jgi:3-isopropylmalate/(R)-2-methylmalate dehydratase large subunit